VKTERPSGGPQRSTTELRPSLGWFEEIERLLSSCEFRVLKNVPRSTNNALLVELAESDHRLAIYKSARLARPLWDFDRESLHMREVAAYLVAKAVGWLFVPPTVLREGPYGNGALQLYIAPQRGVHYFEFAEDPRYQGELMRLCAFDVIVNNADRKAGHCLLDAAGCLWSIDHGTCFHVDDKLRSVIWQFGGKAIPTDVLADLEALQKDLSCGARDRSSTNLGDLESLLEPEEGAALLARVTALVEAGFFPDPGDDPPLPWPPI
jgi:uncharacterized repeat protein (TIGR03843 family)